MKKYYCPGCRAQIPTENGRASGTCKTCGRDYVFDAYGPVVEKRGRIYIANEIPVSVRTKHVISALFLIFSGLLGILLGGIFVPVSGFKGIVVGGILAWASLFGMLVAAAVLLSVVLDHYDKRDNERMYRQFAFYGEAVSWSIWLAVVLTYGILDFIRG